MSFDPNEDLCFQPLNAPDPNRIVSVYRPRVDACDRLWFVDTGVQEGADLVVVQRPSLWVINLNSDSFVRRYEFPESLVPRDTGRGLVSLTIDDPDGSCTAPYVYISDWFSSRMVVYSFAENRAWNVQHNYFHFDPLYGDFNVAGFQFTRRDGLFSVALSPRRKDGHKVALFHPMCSNVEFMVSTETLKNETLATRSYHGQDFRVRLQFSFERHELIFFPFQLLGRRGGTRSQAGIELFDVNSKVLFTTQLQRNAIDCWALDRHFSESFISTIDQNDELLFYPVDMIVSSR